jgi:hypothetical protein
MTVPMTEIVSRSTMQQVYIRLCRDSCFTIDAVRAAQLAAAVCNVHPLQIWLALDWDTMQRIAAGTHPLTRSATKQDRGQQ